MTLPRLRGKIFGRRSVRARIAVACAGLFLIIAAAFTAALYTVVDRSFGPTPPPSSVPAGLARTCQTAEANGTLKLDPALMTQCQYFLGAANQRTHDLHQLLLWSLAGLGVATIVAGISGWAIGRRILLPLHTITTAARRASRERLDERISLDGPADELKELADTFDDMLNRLDLAFASQRRFVANASHELRTPLTSMRTLIDVAMAKPTRTTGQLEVLAGRVREALDQSDALIDGLLTLARSDRGLTTRELVDLEAAAQDAIDHASTAARTSDIVIDADLSPAPTLGDRVLLERLVANLLDNAVHYNLTGGSVRVVTGSDDDVSYITVTNSGPLVPESAVTSLFEPFTRLEGRVSNSRGAGLGLSIVTSVVNAHHGHLDAEALPDGGMKISARLPKTTVGTSTDDIGQPVKDRIPPSMNTRSKSSLPTATTLSANPGAVVRHKPREGSVCRQLSFPTRWSAILADLWPASPEPAILPRGPSPPDPHAAAGAGRSASVVLGLRGETQLFWVDMDRAGSLSGGASHPERQVLDYIKTNIHITSSGMLPERLLRHTLDFTSADRSPAIPATGPCHSDRAVLRGHPPPRGVSIQAPGLGAAVSDRWLRLGCGRSVSVVAERGVRDDCGL